MNTWELTLTSRIAWDSAPACNPLPGLPFIVQSTRMPRLTEDQLAEARAYHPYFVVGYKRLCTPK